ncbi:hypothetical protein GCM10010168_21370 [Actinoplanes ianthinogenes]|uniref:Uncharacterized protein n=1 Tax=Actinoplanes ianthinogenes TaxID=122358 RepID=A0ABM7M816_9ACTN|nr:DUF6228 family protein [Actinoplanes ianthinogenes]BCJ47778.1 hypothetical protein Aiant_84350 [Actinoplanes ianthinogenes]GGR04113.1 hypothetical protein GCM10010168_21370 [Actinoplanes ianthinogenes]
MEEPFVLGGTDDARWVVHPPQDPHGDGYVYRVRAELHDDGMSAVTVATVFRGFAGSASTLAEFVAGLAADWQGWDGSRDWRSADHELTLDARHDGRRHVSLGVTLRAPGPSWDRSAWSARAVFVLEAGEEMTRFAADLAHWLSTQASSGN